MMASTRPRTAASASGCAYIARPTRTARPSGAQGSGEIVGIEVGGVGRLVAGGAQALLEGQERGLRRAAGARWGGAGGRGLRFVARVPARRAARAPGGRAHRPGGRAGAQPGRRPCRRRSCPAGPAPKDEGSPRRQDAATPDAAARTRRRADSGRRLARAVMHVRAPAGRRDRSASAQSTDDGRGRDAGRGDHVAARRPRARAPRPGSAPRAGPRGRSTGSSWTCTERTRASRAGAAAAQPVAAPTEPDHSVPVTTVPMPLQRERAIDVQPRRRRRRPRAQAAPRRAVERRAAARRARRRARRDRHDLGCRDEAPPPPPRAARVGEVRLGHRDDAVVDAERAQHRQVLARLRHHAVVGGDAHQDRSIPVAPGDHRPHEALVARHVDDREPAAARQRERRVAELDRDPARCSSGQPVGVLPVSARMSAVLP